MCILVRRVNLGCGCTINGPGGIVAAAYCYSILKEAIRNNDPTPHACAITPDVTILDIPWPPKSTLQGQISFPMCVFHHMNFLARGIVDPDIPRLGYGTFHQFNSDWEAYGGPYLPTHSTLHRLLAWFGFQVQHTTIRRPWNLTVDKLEEQGAVIANGSSRLGYLAPPHVTEQDYENAVSAVRSIYKRGDGTANPPDRPMTDNYDPPRGQPSWLELEWCDGEGSAAPKETIVVNGTGRRSGVIGRK
ncbi:hypothetical protein MMC25_005991 [Agyrium rufum]|nr:hypothetical protein [Agyrium rufum]